MRNPVMLCVGCLLSAVAGFSAAVPPLRSAALTVRHASRSAGHPLAVVVDISSTEEFDAALESAGEALVVVDYSTSWCGPCKIIAPKFDEFSEQYKNVNFLKVCSSPLPFPAKEPWAELRCHLSGATMHVAMSKCTRGARACR